MTPWMLKCGFKILYSCGAEGHLPESDVNILSQMERGSAKHSDLARAERLIPSKLA